MSARKPEPGVSRLGMFARRWRFDHNPLRRPTDRFESAALALLVAAFLISTPIATLATGARVHGAARQAQLAEQASRRQVTAVVLTVTAPQVVGQDFIWQAQASWRAPDGREVTHVIPVPTGTAAGGKLQVWTDLTGDPSTAPLLDSQVASQTVYGEMIAAIGSAGVVTISGALVLWALNKRRMAAWDAEWQATGPHWTTHA